MVLGLWQPINFSSEYSQICEIVVKYIKQNNFGGKIMNRVQKLMEETKYRGFGCATITTR